MPAVGMTGRSEPTGQAPKGSKPPEGGEPPPFPNGGTPAVSRFGGPGGTLPSGPSYEPGVVEVEFREGVTPDITQPPDGAPPEVRSIAEGPLDEFNRILMDNNLVTAESTFLITPQEATSVQARAASKGFDTPNLARFVTLHFADEADTVAIASRLDALPEVERAIAVPVALPPTVMAERPGGATVLAPSAPLAEPLVGMGGTVVVDTVTGLENQWYIFRCGVNQAWGMSTGRDVVVADVDWGYRTSHNDLAGRISKTYNAFDGTTDVTSGDVSHGTAVMGLAGATVNHLGMAGVAYDSTLWAVRSDSGTGEPLGGDAWARGIDWVRTTDSGGRRKVVILEVQTGAYGNYEYVPSVNAAIRTAIAAGVVVCVAAGNGDRDAGIGDDGRPIPETGSILVGATAYDATVNKRAWFSNYGPRIVVCAPGDDSHDVTCDSSSDTAYRNPFGGTSGATPKVAGTVALMLAANPGLSHAEVRQMLNATGTAVTPDPGKDIGTFLNAGAAVREASEQAAGRMEIFARGGDQALWHMWQTAPNNGWSGWESLGGWIDMLSYGRNADGRLEVFARGADQAVWHMWQTAPNNGWSGWESLGGWIDNLKIAQNNDGRMEIFARGADGAVWHMWQIAPNGTWSSWESLGGWVDDLDIGRNADGRMEVFARGGDQALWHKWQTTPGGGWSGWESLGGWIDRLATARNADGRLEVFARGADQALWHMWQTAPNNGWSGWESLGGWIDMLALDGNADGRLEVFARGADQAVWHMWQTAPNNGWSGWESLGGWIDDLDISKNADGRLEIFARGADGAVWHMWQTAPNNGWSGWESLGGWIDRLAVAQNAP
ncbi:S8 family serine peptidase [Streptomyces sp. P9(2023)]|uniref:S8 family serine peptidase n=1 Tax=Streptomyces sp. P9(2023) TaxID=3064394 RepID=UPI0028F41C86|nr:S8 family serine peptidase [Streptomyces sp. P9(2023)]MDT9687585.1 S8 family serine peptidase [Streptomyces sp. P9(2023)]